MLKHFVTLFMLLVLAGGIMLWEFSPEQMLRDPEPVRADFPQAYVIGSHSRQFDEQGQLRYVLVTEEVNHYQYHANRASDRDYTWVENPDITLLDPEQPPWYLTAERGRSNPGDDSLTLIEQVRLWQEAERGLVEMTTPEITLWPERQFAKTYKPVKMRAPGGNQEAVGLEADLGEDRIQLLSEVRGTYAP